MKSLTLESARPEKPLLEHVSGACGVDEAGRGTLAGPVVVAAVILPDGFDLAGIRDSKQLSREEREEAAQRIRREARFHVEHSDVDEIDQKNILWATMAAMERAVQALGAKATIFIDGDRCPYGVAGVPVVKGDATYACIAAASILAKTTRDDLMRSLDERYPGYGFADHFGYATPVHFEAIRRLGPCEIHRKSFSPIKEMLLQPCLDLGA